MTTGTSDAGFAGQKSPSDTSSQFNVTSFLIKQMLGRVRTVGVAKILAVYNPDVLDTPPTVDVQPVINMLDGNNNSTQHGTVCGLPYIRLGGSSGSTLTPPVVGEFVVTLTADRDISAFKNNKDISNPGSLRRFDLADGIALGGICNGAPAQYMRFKLDGDGNPAGVDLVDALGNSIKTSSTGIDWEDLSGNTIVSNSDGITINGVKFDRSSNVSAPGEVTAKSGSGGSVTLTEHKHGTGSPAAGTSAPTGGT